MNQTIAPRCTFAIISHPDAGKTTITEKILWHGQVIRTTGMVKSKSGNFAKSDWMELEKQRGISVTSSIMSFPYAQRLMHLLDTPGHQDFSEDTYRTLTAVESVLMMIDAAKGVEAQTIKLMEVCRLRDTPIITFINKFDRQALDPFALLDNLESILSIHCCPLNWPIGSGIDFKGIYQFCDQTILCYDDHQTIIDARDLTTEAVVKYLGPELVTKLQQDLEMIADLITPFEQEEFLAGILTPVFFGSALYNFGVKQVLDMFAQAAPGPLPREVKLPPYDVNAAIKTILPESNNFSGFIFKIQANMDKKHRDRVAFLRVCSGKFERNKKIFHVRSQKELKIAAPLIFQAQDREITEEAYPGDIIGLHDTGRFQIGDTFTEGETFIYTGIPCFAPEIFMKVLLKDPMKSKQLEKGLQQLSEEGTVQLFTRALGNEKILGAVGPLQFEVVRFRLEDEYGVRGEYQTYHFIGMRWLKFPDLKLQQEFTSAYSQNIVYDNKQRLCYGVKSEWDLKLVQEKNPTIGLFKNSEYR